MTHPGDRCPECGRFYPTKLSPAAEARYDVDRWVSRYGSVRRAGFAYAERFGLSPKAGERVMGRILRGGVTYVTEVTLDRLSVI